jgi:hypothetical protein
VRQPDGVLRLMMWRGKCTSTAGGRPFDGVDADRAEALRASASVSREFPSITTVRFSVSAKTRFTGRVIVRSVILRDPPDVDLFVKALMELTEIPPVARPSS